MGSSPAGIPRSISGSQLLRRLPVRRDKVAIGFPQGLLVRREDIADDLDRVLALGASEDAEDDVVELRGRAQQQTPLDGPAGDLDEGTSLWDEAQMATHAQE